MYVFRSLGFLRDFLLRDCDTTYFGPAILQYVNGGIGNDGRTRTKPSNLTTKRSRVKLCDQSSREPLKGPVISLSWSHFFCFINIWVPTPLCRPVNKGGLMVDLMQITPPYIFKAH